MHPAIVPSDSGCFYLISHLCSEGQHCFYLSICEREIAVSPQYFTKLEYFMFTSEIGMYHSLLLW